MTVPWFEAIEIADSEDPEWCLRIEPDDLGECIMLTDGLSSEVVWIPLTLAEAAAAAILRTAAAIRERQR